jgi:predicted DNA-binding protein with PD1-like motif
MKYQKLNASTYLIRIDQGEEVTEGLLAFALQSGIGSASLSGCGGLEDVHLGYFHTQSGEYISRPLPSGLLELVSLTGTLTIDGGDPSLHVHAVVADEDLRCYGGHLLGATVAATAEIVAITTSAQVSRSFNDQLKIRELDL